MRRTFVVLLSKICDLKVRYTVSSASSDPRNTSSTQGQRYLIYVLLVSLKSKFHFISLYSQLFLSYWPFGEHCAK